MLLKCDGAGRTMRVATATLITGTFAAIGCGDAPQFGNGTEGMNLEGFEPDAVASTVQTLTVPRVTQVSSVYTLPGNGRLDNMVVSCPSGSTLVGGGYVGSANSSVYTSYASRGSWVVSAYNRSASSMPFNVVAECLSGVANSTLGTVWGARKSVPAGGNACQRVACPSGSILVSGGYSSTTPFRSITHWHTGTSWEVCGQNENNFQSIQFDAMAVCLQGVSGSAYLQSWAYRILPGTTLKANTQPCPGNQLISVAGYSTPLRDGAKLFLNTTARNFQEPTRWNHEFRNIGSTEINVGVQTVCLLGLQ